jgi:two-component system chemotaxis response regulator CheB
MRKRIKVLVVDDSLLFRKTLEQVLSKDVAIEVVGTAVDAYDARDKIIELNPDVMSLDVEMPRMNGIEFLKRLMPQHPMPVVVVSSINDNVFDAINAGAVDFVEKPKVTKPEDLDDFFRELTLKLKIASTARLENKKKPVLTGRKKPLRKEGLGACQSIIAIGASTGGTEAVSEIIRSFPQDMPPTLVVQHMPPVFTKLYAERLNKLCQVEVKEAEDEDWLLPGRVIIAKGGFQMKLVKKSNGYQVQVYEGDKVNGHCPSVEPMFETVAELFGEQAIGIILTGMGTDGAKGLLDMRKAGAFTIGQDEKTSVVYGMPKAAYNMGAVMTQASLQKIPEIIFDHLNKMKGR